MIENRLDARRIAIVGTLRCTLKCKLCCNLMQKFMAPYDVSSESMKADIEHIFELFDHIEWLQFVGGEIFINKHMAEVYEYALCYKEKFDKLILMTNATLEPREEEINVLKKYKDKCEIMISDYGQYSYKLREMVALCEKAGIPYIVKSYHGNNQYENGWIDNTNFVTFTGTETDLARTIKNCPQIHMENMHCLQGKLHICSNSCFMSALGVSEPAKKDFIDLNDQSISKKEKKQMIRSFYKSPVTACKICSFKDIKTSKRFPAAEQLKL